MRKLAPYNVVATTNFKTHLKRYMKDLENDLKREQAYDEVMRLRTQDFLHFRLERYQTPLEDIIILYNNDNNKHKN